MVLDSICKRFLDTAIREKCNLKPEIQIKTHSNNWGNHFQQNEVKKKLQPVPFIYVWRKFEHQVKDMCSFQKVQVFSSLRRPEAQFRLAQGHHQAGAITGSINNIQNTSITVYEVESHKTVNTKFWERTNWFSELIQEIFHHNFQQSYTRRHEKIQRKIECNAKAYQPILQNTTAEKYKHVQRTDQNISRTIEKIWCRQKGIKNEQFMDFFSPCGHEVDVTRHNPTKISKNNPFVVKSVSDSNCKRFRDIATRENFNLKPEIQKKLISTTKAAICIITMK